MHQLNNTTKKKSDTQTNCALKSRKLLLFLQLVPFVRSEQCQLNIESFEVSIVAVRYPRNSVKLEIGKNKIRIQEQLSKPR